MSSGSYTGDARHLTVGSATYVIELFHFGTTNQNDVPAELQ